MARNTEVEPLPFTEKEVTHPDGRVVRYKRFDVKRNGEPVGWIRSITHVNGQLDPYMFKPVTGRVYEVFVGEEMVFDITGFDHALMELDRLANKA